MNPRRDSVMVRVLVSHASVATSILVEAPGGALLVDCGDGAATALARGRLARPLAGIAFTHGHPDHVGGLWSVLCLLRSRGQQKALRLLAPAGCREPRLLLGSWRLRYAGSRPTPTRMVTAEAGRERRLGPFGLTPFPVRHQGNLGDGRRGLMPAVGWRIACRGRTVVISGDTGPCDEVERAVEGADLALVEASFARSRPGLEDLHLSVAQARAVGRKARSYRLYHLSEESRPLLRPGEAAGRHRLTLTEEA